MKNGNIKRMLVFMTAIIFFGLVSLVINGEYVSAGDTTTVSVEGYLDYEKAFEVLELLNESRREAGLEELKMDKRLLESAMTRAVETSLYFSHERPDNSKYYTVDDYIYGENIAAGRDSAKGTFEQWWNSEGHKRNMMKDTYTCVGIGVAKVNGIYYWSQEFGFTLRKECKTGTNRNETKVIVADIDNLSIYKEVEGTVEGNTGNIMELNVFNQNKGFTFASVKLENSHILWKSSNEKKAVVTKDGIIKCLSAGDVDISAYYRGTKILICKWNLKLTGKDFSEDTIDGSIGVKRSAIKKITVLKNGRIRIRVKKSGGATGYQVQYSTRKNMKRGKRKRYTKTTINLKKFSKGTKVYVRVRSYKDLSTGGLVYSKWSKIKKVVV